MKLILEFIIMALLFMASGCLIEGWKIHTACIRHNSVKILWMSELACVDGTMAPVLDEE